MSRIDIALNPLVENRVSAALRMASRILGLRVIGFAFHRLVLYNCTNNKVQSTNMPRAGEATWPGGATVLGLVGQSPGRLLPQHRTGGTKPISHWPGHGRTTDPRAHGGSSPTSAPRAPTHRPL